MAARKRINTNADVNTATTAAETFMKTPKENADVETPMKTRRVQLLLVPEEWEKFQALAHLAGGSCNEMIGNFVHYAVTQYSDQIRKYEKARDLMRQELNIIEEDKPHE